MPLTLLATSTSRIISTSSTSHRSTWFTPKLVCGTAPKKGEHTFGLVRNLARLRNDLVHAKSNAFPLAQLEAAAEHYDDYHARLEKGADDAIACVLAVMRELDKLHGTESFEKY